VTRHTAKIEGSSQFTKYYKEEDFTRVSAVLARIRKFSSTKTDAWGVMSSNPGNKADQSSQKHKRGSLLIFAQKFERIYLFTVTSILVGNGEAAEPLHETGTCFPFHHQNSDIVDDGCDPFNCSR
jgi:hypothetical protein